MADCGCGCGSGGSARVTRIEPARAEAHVVQELGTEILWRDRLGTWKVRWGIGRMRYSVAPGLYRIGQPGENAPVLVTANYKLTVDEVRRRLRGLSVWLLVLDTKGVNVWCAAGKGTFGTCELVRRIQEVKLAEVVKHRKLVLPQLSATGVAAHEVKLKTGFSVNYGPVRARDIPAYLAAGMTATKEMRRVTFGWRERVVLAPNEIVGALKLLLAVLVVLAGLDALRHHRLTPHLAADMIPFAAALFTGGVLVPLLLPWLPFRMFALKGAVAGALAAIAVVLLLPMTAAEAAGTVLLVLAITSYMAMTFTGSSTYTSLAGVRVEVGRMLPAILVSAGLGAILRITGAFI